MLAGACEGALMRALFFSVMFAVTMPGAVAADAPVVPQSAEEFADRCSARIDKSDYDGASEDCSRAIALKPGDADAYHSRAMAYMAKNDNDHAIADCDA